MHKLTYILLIWIGLLMHWNLFGQTPAIDKILYLPTGDVSLKTVFNSISKQTGYVFSYDANKINDEKRIVIEKNNAFTLETSLNTLLTSDIRYKIIDKYIVLYKKSSEDIPIFIKPPLSIASSTTILQTATNLSDSLQFDPISYPSDSSIIGKERIRRQLSIETNVNPHLTNLSLLMGKETLFGKASIGYDLNESYHMGLGIGTNIKLLQKVGLSLDLSQYALAFGKTRNMDINTYTTVLNPLIFYTLNKKIKLKFGPTFHYIKSNLNTKNASIDLGSHLGCDATIGMQILLVESK